MTEKRPARRTVVMGAQLILERFQRQQEEFVRAAAEEEGLDLDEGWKLDTSGFWHRTVEQ